MEASTTPKAPALTPPWCADPGRCNPQHCDDCAPPALVAELMRARTWRALWSAAMNATPRRHRARVTSHVDRAFERCFNATAALCAAIVEEVAR